MPPPSVGGREPPIAIIVASIMLAAIVRPSPGSAAVPPPAERTIVNGETTSSALLIRNPITQRAIIAAGKHVHEVVKGESLWRIARTILERLDGEATGAEISTLWRAIYAANKDVIGGDPNLIHPGQVLTIPGGVHG